MDYLPDMLRTVLLLLLLSFVSISAKAQNFDYQTRPEFDYGFKSAKINLRINPKKVALKGSVTYRLEANINGADTLLLNAPGITIHSVRSNGLGVYFEHKNEKLKIALTDSSRRGKEYTVTIYYKAKPQFGLLKSSEGTVWTSMLPRATRHWLPVRDNPRNRMNVTLSLRVPYNFKVFASGISRGKHMFRDSTKKITFKTGSAIPITSLAFGIGHFHGINSFAEPNSISAENQRKLVSKTKHIVQEISNVTGMPYPFQRVTLAILNDDHWETKAYGASTVFLYTNRGNWMTQLRRGLVAQWIGVYLNEGQWTDSWPIRLMQATLLSKITNSETYLAPNSFAPKPSFTTAYSYFGVKNWNFWQEYKIKNLPKGKNIVLDVMRSLLDKGPATITPEMFTRAWYKASGQPEISLAAYHPQKPMGKNTVEKNTTFYRVHFKLNKQANSMKFVFKVDSNSVSLQQPVAISLVVIPDSSNRKRQLRLFGAVDTATVSLPAGTRNVRLKVPERRNLKLKIIKPASYSLYQLHHAEKTTLRVKAARQLGYHTNMPDLQLAIVNAMKKENKPKVRAALLHSYGEITQGANGTQKHFLNALSSDNKLVKLAALEGLKNYESSAITQRLKKFTQNAANTSLANKAFNIFMQQIDSTTALNYANTLVQQDTSGTKAIVAVKALANSGYTKRAVRYANFYVKPYYAYPVRKKALQVLVQYADTTQNWNKLLKTWLNDLDPRIRYLAVKNSDNVPVKTDSILKSHKEKEYDARVYRKMMKVIPSEDSDKRQQ